MKKIFVLIVLSIYDIIWFVYSKILKLKVVYKSRNTTFKMNSVGHISKEIFREIFFGKFELNERIFVENSLNQNSNVLNIGSNIGFYTLLCAKMATNGKIFSFEPSSSNFKNLINNIKLNSLDNIVAYNIGLGEFEGETELFKDSSNPNLDSHYTVVNEFSENLVLEKIPIKRLDSFLSDFPPIDLIIIDVEGYELEVLQGASLFLREFPYATYLIETTKNHKNVVEIMKANGFSPLTISYNGDLSPAVNFHGNLVFKNIQNA